ncbi:MAG: hypothetical protein QOC92_4488 [Acidimicrobiaceae bacterium]|jgi:hypothetical protein
MTKAPSKTGRWALLSGEDIPAKDGSGDVYLHRFRIIKTPWFALYLHDLNLPDNDRDPHDHPWTFWSLVLRGHYKETVYEQCPDVDEFWSRSTYLGVAQETYKRRWLAGSVHRMGMDKAHKIDSVGPKTKTLVFCGRRRRNWGFWTPQGFESWQSYIAKHYPSELTVAREKRGGPWTGRYASGPR